MSFYTSIYFYRPSPPPPVFAGDLAKFIAAVRDTGLLFPTGQFGIQVKFGKSIDQDDKPTYQEEGTLPGISSIHSIKWDIDILMATSLQSMIDCLAPHNKRVYRALINLGALHPSAIKSITRLSSPENEIDFTPNAILFEVGPIHTSSLTTDISSHVGWLAVSFSGPGYLYPWTIRDVIKRIEISPTIQRIAEVARSLWPVRECALKRRTIALRKQLGDLWPYDSLNMPMNWYWGIHETG